MSYSVNIFPLWLLSSHIPLQRLRGVFGHLTIALWTLKVARDSAGLCCVWAFRVFSRSTVTSLAARSVSTCCEARLTPGGPEDLSLLPPHSCLFHLTHTQSHASHDGPSHLPSPGLPSASCLSLLSQEPFGQGALLLGCHLRNLSPVKPDAGN